MNKKIIFFIFLIALISLSYFYFASYRQSPDFIINKAKLSYYINGYETPKYLLNEYKAYLLSKKRFLNKEQKDAINTEIKITEAIIGLKETKTFFRKQGNIFGINCEDEETKKIKLLSSSALKKIKEAEAIANVKQGSKYFENAKKEISEIKEELTTHNNILYLICP